MKFALLTAFLALAPSISGIAHALEAPTGPVVLTVSGKSVTEKNYGDTAAFDMAMLEKLSGRRASMEPPWTTGVTTFYGPFVRALL